MYVLQSEGVSKGCWPGYSVDNSSDYIYKNICGIRDVRTWGGASLDLRSNLTALYAGIQYAEASGGLDASGKYVSGTANKNGLYFISRDKVDAVDYYKQALVAATKNSGLISSSTEKAWLGSVAYDSKGWFISTSGDAGTDSQGNEYILAPAFNLNASAINLKIQDGIIYVIPKGLREGGEYEMGTFIDKSDNARKPLKWICTSLDGNYATMQSEGMSHGTAPAVNGNGLDSIFVDISSICADLKPWYNTWKSVEANGGRDNSTGIWNAGDNIKKDGLYLIDRKFLTKDQRVFDGYLKKGIIVTPYYYALHNAAANYKTFGATKSYAWLGSASNSTNFWYVYSTGDVEIYGNADYDGVIAPAFNLDISKIIVTGNEIKRK